MMRLVILSSLLITCIAIAPIASTDELILFETFEDYEVDANPEGWDADNPSHMVVVDDPVKNGKRSLMINNPPEEEDVWYEFDREVQVVSLEFWVYPSTSNRTLTLLLMNNSTARENGGPYLGWGPQNAGFLDRYTGGSWGPTGVRFQDREWTYVKVVADLTRSPKSYDVYLGEGPHELPDEPQCKNLPYRSTAMSVFDRVLFLGYGGAAAYLDDFLIYEGTERPSDVYRVSVEPGGKLAGKWGMIRAK